MITCLPDYNYHSAKAVSKSFIMFSQKFVYEISVRV